MSMSAFPPIAAGNTRIALVEAGEEITYAALAGRIDRCAAALLGGRDDLAEERVAFLLPASSAYVVLLQAVWRAGGIAVPLNTASTLPELEHYLGSARVTRLVVDGAAEAGLADLCERLGIEVLDAASLDTDPVSLPALAPERRAMIIFTSGTTSKPKGVVSTHANVAAQVTTLLSAWEWSDADSIPLFLPLHHVHGIINVLCCALWAGARVDLFAGFGAARVCAGVAAGRYSCFMAVPTVYVKLIEHIGKLPEHEAQAIRAGFAAMRLNVSGSAACPVPLFEAWRELTGQVLLERYGMTEIGMALSNPYRGERRAGHVGQPLPGVSVILCDEAGEAIAGEDQPGEIRVRGPGVFLEYWDNPQATASSFVEGWFRTGDMAVLEQGSYRIMGRSSVDIIKSGGYKLSALEIENVLLEHPAIAEVAVLGIEDPTWGEVVGAVVALKPGTSLSATDLRAWCGGRISDYKAPRLLRVVPALPRNAMGKVTKPELRTLF